MKYRREIDGLRAIAVLPVLFFHAGFNFMHRGFLGVDIFFVISGFLITSIITTEIKNGSFSYSAFYYRRIKRILPILVTVLLVSTIVAFVTLFPDELDTYSKSMIAGLLFYANFFFYSLLGGYFSADAAYQPLLHLWSLAVEEQFYLIFPPLLLLLFKYGKHLVTVSITALLIGSLIFCIAYGKDHQMFAFYMLPTRFWELGAGALLAISALDKKQLSRQKLNTLAWIGLFLIAYSLTAIPKHLAFPGWATIPVIMGTILILGFAREKTTVARILSCKPLVGIGLISYSAYLWHQPIFVFTRLYYEHISDTTYWILIALTLLISIISWKYIEKPFRQNKTKTNKIKTIKVSVSLIIGLCLLAVCLPHLYAHSPYRIANPYQDTPPVDRNGFQCVTGPYTKATCTYGENPEVLVLGDSFANHLAGALLNSKSKQPFLVSSFAACPPIFNFADTLIAPEQKNACLEFQNSIKSEINKNKAIKYVILSSAIDYYITEKPMLTTEGEVQSNPLIVYNKFKEIIQWLDTKNIKVVIISPPARKKEDPNVCIKNKLRHHNLPGSKEFQKCLINQKESIDNTNGVNALLQGLTAFAPIVHLDNLMCENGVCPVLYNGHPIYADRSHLTEYGSDEIGKRFDLFGIAISEANKFKRGEYNSDHQSEMK